MTARISGSIAALVAVLLAILWIASAPSGIEALRAEVAAVPQKWPAIGHISTQRLARLMSEGRVALFDVRTEQEFRVSRIPGAENVEADVSPRTFFDRYGTMVQSKAAVFYCSVGVRSSQLASRLAAELKVRGATAVYNLEGGIFAWHDEARPLVDDRGVTTTAVHPFDGNWGRLLGHMRG